MIRETVLVDSYPFEDSTGDQKVISIVEDESKVTKQDHTNVSSRYQEEEETSNDDVSMTIDDVIVPVKNEEDNVVTKY